MNKDALRKMTALEHEQLRKLAEGGNAAAVAVLDAWVGLKSPTVCEEAESLIYGDREKTHGEPSKNLARIAEFWERYLCARLRNSLEHAIVARTGMKPTAAELRYLTAVPGVELFISVTDVCHMMQMLKWARDENQPMRDNVVDDIGYAALVDRCRNSVFNGMGVHFSDHGNTDSAAGTMGAEVGTERKPPKRATKPIHKSSKRKTRK